MNRWNRPRTGRRLTCLGLSLALCASVSFAQQGSYPAKPITYMVGYGAGSGIDGVARVVAQTITANWTQPVVVENRPGAAGYIALDTVSKAAPDGYTMLIASASDLINQHASRSAKLDMARDFAAVSMTGALPLALVISDSLPVKNVEELVALAKARPGKLNYAAVVGASPHFMGEVFKTARGIDMTMVPYKTTNDATSDVIGGRVEVMFTTLSAAVTLAQGKKVRVLAITGRDRSPAMPDVPTMTELGLPAVDVGIGYFVVVPKNTPKPVIAALNAQFAKALGTKDVRDRLIAAGVDPKSSTPDELETAIRSESARWATLVKELGIRVD